MYKAFPVAVVLVGLLAVAAMAQSALERVEKQVHKRLDLPDAAAPATESTDSKSNDRPQALPPIKNATERGYLGALAEDREDRGRGVRIVKVLPGTAADRAGLKVGDLVTGLGGVRVREMADFAAVLGDIGPDNTLTFEILRGQDRRKDRTSLSVAVRRARGDCASARDGWSVQVGCAADPRRPARVKGDCFGRRAFRNLGQAASRRAATTSSAGSLAPQRSGPHSDLGGANSRTGIAARASRAGVAAQRE